MFSNWASGSTPLGKELKDNLEGYNEARKHFVEKVLPTFLWEAFLQKLRVNTYKKGKKTTHFYLHEWMALATQPKDRVFKFTLKDEEWIATDLMSRFKEEKLIEATKEVLYCKDVDTKSSPMLKNKVIKAISEGEHVVICVTVLDEKKEKDDDC